MSIRIADESSVIGYDRNGNELFSTSITDPTTGNRIYDLETKPNGSSFALLNKKAVSPGSTEVVKVGSEGLIKFRKQINDENSGLKISESSKGNLIVAIDLPDTVDNPLKFIEIDANGNILNEKVTSYEAAGKAFQSCPKENNIVYFSTIGSNVSKFDIGSNFSREWEYQPSTDGVDMTGMAAHKKNNYVGIIRGDEGFPGFVEPSYDIVLIKPDATKKAQVDLQKGVDFKPFSNNNIDIAEDKSEVWTTTVETRAASDLSLKSSTNNTYIDQTDIKTESNAKTVIVSEGGIEYFDENQNTIFAKSFSSNQFRSVDTFSPVSVPTLDTLAAQNLQS